MPFNRKVLFNKVIGLKPGGEWHTKPIELHKGDILTISASGNEKFYAGIFDRVEYHRKVGADGGMFGFEFGTDSRGFTHRVQAKSYEDYYVVLRVGIFSGSARIQCRIELLRRMTTAQA